MRALTTYVIILSVIVLVGYDVWAIYKGGVEASISFIIYESSFDHPVIPLLFGFLMGHFFPVTSLWNAAMIRLKSRR